MKAGQFLALAAVTAAAPFTPNPANFLQLSRRSEEPTIFTCSAASWPPTTVGKPNLPQEPSEDLASILSQVNATNIENIILKLVSFGTRHTLSEQNSTTRGVGAAR